MTHQDERIQKLFPELEFDPLALREKYRSERERRLRRDGEAQYKEDS